MDNRKQEFLNKISKLEKSNPEAIVPLLLNPASDLLREPDDSDPNAVKCPRCWHYHYIKMNFDNLCDNCCHIILDCFPDHWSVEGIKKAYQEQKEYYKTKKGELRINER